MIPAIVGAVILIASASVAEEEPLDINKLNFEFPKFSEEEEHSKAMPDSEELRCDACGILAQHWAGAFLHSEALKKRPLSELQYGAALEHVCKGEKSLEEYGVKQVDSKVRLSGHGAFGDAAAGVISGGGVWESRLRSACTSMIGDIGEEELYEKFTKIVPALGKKQVTAEASKEGVEKFARAICVKKEEKGKKKKKRKSSQQIRNSCTEVWCS